MAITSILDQIGVPYDRMVLKGANATALQMVAGTLSDGAGNGKYQGIILETGDLPYQESTCPAPYITLLSKCLDRCPVDDAAAVPV